LGRGEASRRPRALDGAAGEPVAVEQAVALSQKTDCLFPGVLISKGDRFGRRELMRRGETG